MFLSLTDLQQRLSSVSLHSIVFSDNNDSCNSNNSYNGNSNNLSNASVMSGEARSPANTTQAPVTVSVMSDDTSNDNHLVPVIVNPRADRKYSRGRNLANLVRVNNSKQCLSYGVCVINARSLFSKMTFVPPLFDQLDVAVISVCETWEHNPQSQHEGQIVSQLKNMHGINYIGAPRVSKRRKRGGGTAILFLEKVFKGERIPLVPLSLIHI